MVVAKRWMFPLFSVLASVVAVFAIVSPVAAAGYPFLYSLKWGTHGTSAGEFDMPWGIGIAQNGHVYVGDCNNRVQEFSPDGTYLGEWGSTGSGVGEFGGPADVAISSANDLYVTDCNNNRVQQFELDGTFVRQWGSAGSAPGQFDRAFGIATDPGGNVYVADQENDRVQVFDSAGNFLDQWCGDSSTWLYPSGIAVDMAGYLYVFAVGHFGPTGDYVLKFESNGNLVDKWPVGTSAFQGAIETDASGNVYVVYGGGSVLQYSSDGELLCEWGEYGDGDGQMAGPMGLAIAPDGSLYVSECYNDRVQRFVPPEVDLDLVTGWNMVSVPLEFHDNAVDVLLPDVEAIYTWDPVGKRYVVPSTIDAQCGYWIAVSEDRTVTLEGLPVYQWDGVVATGWNMVGAVFGGTCDFENPVTTPYAGSVEGFAYTWDPITKSYQYCTDLCSTTGYWVAATKLCTLSLGPP